jgi:DHA1 family bicyclomycin/chloramphenicol resistance-like MFS transporter
LSAIVLASLGLSGKGGLLVTVPLFVFISSLGFVFPNSTAGALAGQGHQAGTASALIGFLQYGGGAVASAAVGALQSVTSAPVQITIGMCGVLSIVTYYRLVGSALRSPATGRNEVC